MAIFKDEHSSRSSRRNSGIVVVHQSNKNHKKKHRRKDSDSSSVSSSSSSDTIVPLPRKCPLRFMLAGLFESENSTGKGGGCPLRKVQLWHTIPLCLLAIVNLLLVIIALLGVAVYRIGMSIQAVALTRLKNEADCNSYAEPPEDTEREVAGLAVVAEYTRRL